MTLKKLAFGLVAFLATLLLVACGSKQATENASPRETADFQLVKAGQMDVRNHYEYRGDKVLKMTTTTTLLYSAIQVDSADAAKQYLEAHGGNKWDGVKGIKHKVDYQGDRMVETTTVDFSKVDINANADLLQVQVPDGKKVDHISFKQSSQALKDQGYTEVKDGKFQELN